MLWVQKFFFMAVFQNYIIEVLLWRKQVHLNPPRHRQASGKQGVKPVQTTKEFMCRHPPRSVWLPSFYWKLSSRCPNEVGKHLLCFFQTNKALSRFSNYPGEFPLSLPTRVFNMMLVSGWPWVYFDPPGHLLQPALTKSWELSLVDRAASYRCRKGFITGCQ